MELMLTKPSWVPGAWRTGFPALQDISGPREERNSSKSMVPANEIWGEFLAWHTSLKGLLKVQFKFPYKIPAEQALCPSPVDWQLHFLLQCQWHFSDTMMKVRENRFGHIRHLATRTPFNSGRVDTVIINDTLIGLNYIVYMFQYDSVHDKFNGTIPIALKTQ